jgi:hypothetical protein
MSNKQALGAVDRRSGSACSNHETRSPDGTHYGTDNLFLTPTLRETFGETFIDDTSWFQENPWCRHRIRLATAEESDVHQTMGWDLPFNAVDLTVVRREADGTLRTFSITAAHLLTRLEDNEPVTPQSFEQVSQKHSAHW